MYEEKSLINLERYPYSILIQFSVAVSCLHEAKSPKARVRLPIHKSSDTQRWVNNYPVVVLGSGYCTIVLYPDGLCRIALL
jgi:hypothetical protein